jgi:hypothetical protein
VSIALSDLVARLQADIPARGGSPSSAQYIRAVEDAVADYSRRKPMTRYATINVVSGTATYSLPEDFLFLIRLDPFAARDGVIYTAAGLVPTSVSSIVERYTVNGLTMTFTPTPSYTLARDLCYAAAHALDDEDEYPYMTFEDTALLMLKAQALALRMQAFSLITSGTGEIVEYAIGDERVKKSSPSERLSAAASSLEAQYLQALQRAVGTVGARARYSEAGGLL